MKLFRHKRFKDGRCANDGGFRIYNLLIIYYRYVSARQQKHYFFIFLKLYDTDSDVAMEAADVLDEACEDEVSWTRFITI